MAQASKNLKKNNPVWWKDENGEVHTGTVQGMVSHNEYAVTTYSDGKDSVLYVKADDLHKGFPAVEDMPSKTPEKGFRVDADGTIYVTDDELSRKINSLFDKQEAAKEELDALYIEMEGDPDVKRYYNEGKDPSTLLYWKPRIEKIRKKIERYESKIESLLK